MRKGKYCHALLLNAMLILVFGLSSVVSAATSCDVDGDGRTGLAETIYSLQVVAGLKPAPPTRIYLILESSNTFTPLTGATTIPIPIGFPEGDSWSRVIALPFDFNFYDTVYPETSLITVTDDMYISFNPYVSGIETYRNDCPFDDTEPNNMIAPFWDDGIAADTTAQLLYKTEGIAPNRRLIIEWRDFDVIGGQVSTLYIISVKVNHQVVLFENGDIEFHYGPRQSPNPDNIDCRHQDLGCSATIGIESGYGSNHIIDLIECEQGTITNGRVIRFIRTD